MKISEYIEQALSVPIYPREFSFAYPVLGLVGEIGEAIDKITMLHVPSNKAEVTKELGDILWYLVNAIEDANRAVVMSDIIYDVTDQLGCLSNSFTQLGARLIAAEDTRSVFVRLLVYSGRITKIAKKAIRDTEGMIPVNKFLELRKSFGEVLLCLFDICTQWSINMDDVAQANIDKLFSRRDRGVLGGSGDNR